MLTDVLTGVYENHKETIPDELTRLTDTKTNGRMLFRYEITLKTTHGSMVDLFNKSLLKLPKPENDNAIADFINHHRGQQEGELEVVLTPLGSQFESQETKLSYDTYVNNYCNIVSSLRDTINGLNLAPHIKLIAKSNSRAINAQGEDVYGPIRCMPIF